MRRSSVRALPVLALSALTACGLVGCGQQIHDPGTVGTSTLAADTELVGRGILMQDSPDADVELCLGAVLTSYPPQCGGPTLAGEFSWDEVESEQQDGVRWTDISYYGVGHFDRDSGTFTLTRPLSADPPEGLALPEQEAPSFPQLCEDPFRGGDENYEDPDLSIQNTFQEQLDQLPGYVESWVSDGERMFNVIVTGDAEEAHATLREVWPGGLCVEQRDAPTAADVNAASEALGKHRDELQLQGWGGQGTLDVSVLIADEATVTRIHEVVQPWLTPEQVRITGDLQPLTP